MLAGATTLPEQRRGYRTEKKQQNESFKSLVPTAPTTPRPLVAIIKNRYIFDEKAYFEQEGS